MAKKIETITASSENKDITERNRLEAVLRAEKDFSDRLINVQQDTVFLFEAVTGKPLRWSKRFVEASGYSDEEIANMKAPDDFFKQDDLRKAKEAMAGMLAGGCVVVGLALVTRQGAHIPFEYSAARIEAADGTCSFLFIGRNIAEHKRVEQELANEHNLLRTIIDNLPFRLYAKDRQHRFILGNKVVLEEMNLPSIDALIGKTDFDFFSRAMAEPFFADEETIFRTGQPLLNKEDTWLLQSGEKVVSLTSKILLRDSRTNAIIGLVGFNHNITERKRAEEAHENLQAQLNQAQKMKSVGLLAGGVAHDFNNILQIILGNVDIVLARMEPDNPLRPDLEEIQSAGRRAADLTRQLLGFARKQTILPRTMDLNATVEGMLKMLRRLIGEDIEMIWTPRAGLWPIRMDPVQIDQILVNLCINARDVIAGVGTVQIATENVRVDELHAARHEGVSAGDYVSLTVSDTGCGMDKETQGKIFEPFFTTKAVGKGTGMGLATVYGIVQQNQGHIGVYSEPGMGATLRIYLPRYLGDDAVHIEESSVKPLVHGCEKVLLVEDDAAILDMSGRFLRELGYTVLVAGTPEEALRLMEEHGGEVSLLVTDVVMPGMSGRELAERMQACYPNLKCLFMSGFTADIITRQGKLDGNNHFIQKPFSLEALAAKVREALDK